MKLILNLAFCLSRLVPNKPFSYSWLNNNIKPKERNDWSKNIKTKEPVWSGSDYSRSKRRSGHYRCRRKKIGLSSMNVVDIPIISHRHHDYVPVQIILPTNDRLPWQIQPLNGGASFRWSFGPIFTWGGIESTTILITHSSLVFVLTKRIIIKNVGINKKEK